MSTVERPSAVAVTSQGRRWRLLPCLTLVLLMELVIFVYLLPADPWFRVKIREWQAQRQYWQREQRRIALMKNDPPLGTRAPEITNPSVDGRKVRLGSKPTIVVFIGACTSCVAASLAKWEQVHKKEEERFAIVVVSRDTEQRIREFLKHTPLTMPIIPDERGILAKAYNAIWIPRIYGIDESARLVWIQKDTTSRTDAQRITQEIGKHIGGVSKQ